MTWTATIVLANSFHHRHPLHHHYVLATTTTTTAATVSTSMGETWRFPDKKLWPHEGIVRVTANASHWALMCQSWKSDKDIKEIACGHAGRLTKHLLKPSLLT